MIKRFEQMDWNEDWEEEDPSPIINKGPYDNQLIYGTDGTYFKCGDRVEYIGNTDLVNNIGTVVDCDEQLTLVCFDGYVFYSRLGVRRNVPIGHGFLTFSKNVLRLI